MMCSMMLASALKSSPVMAFIFSTAARAARPQMTRGSVFAIVFHGSGKRRREVAVLSFLRFECSSIRRYSAPRVSWVTVHPKEELHRMIEVWSLTAT